MVPFSVFGAGFLITSSGILQERLQIRYVLGLFAVLFKRYMTEGENISTYSRIQPQNLARRHVLKASTLSLG